jgi:hypothetical protein
VRCNGVALLVGRGLLLVELPGDVLRRRSAARVRGACAKRVRAERSRHRVHHASCVRDVGAVVLAADGVRRSGAHAAAAARSPLCGCGGALLGTECAPTAWPTDTGQGLLGRTGRRLLHAAIRLHRGRGVAVLRAECVRAACLFKHGPAR